MLNETNEEIVVIMIRLTLIVLATKEFRMMDIMISILLTISLNLFGIF
jgi:hypothetical protein